MGVRFSADEVLAIAERIERNGNRFYLAAAERVAAPKSHALLADLAMRERGHERIFTEMRARLSAREKDVTAPDPYDEESLYLQALADETVFKQDLDPRTCLGPSGAYEDILAAAIGMEKESIVFYVGLREFVPESLGRTQVDAILKEEMSHLRLLNQERRQLNA